MSFQIAKNETTLAQPSSAISNARDKRIKVLIPYDGSENSEPALNELSRAGLPESLHAIVAVTNVWLPLSPYEISRAVTARRLKVLNAGASSFVPALREYEERQALSLEAERRIRSMFPSGSIRAEALHDTGAIANEILREAKHSGVDLIIVGSNTGPSPHITDYAGPAAKVAREANCSVRIARASGRAPVHKNESPVRIIIAVDGSDPATLVQVVADRVWPTSSEVRLVKVVKNGPRDPEKDHKTTLMLDEATQELRAKGLTVSITTTDGKPEDVLLQQARAFAADCIFIQPRAYSYEVDGSYDGGVLGKTAEALALGAFCSVEIVRANKSRDQYLKPAA